MMMKPNTLPKQVIFYCGYGGLVSFVARTRMVESPLFQACHLNGYFQ